MVDVADVVAYLYAFNCIDLLMKLGQKFVVPVVGGAEEYLGIHRAHATQFICETLR